MYDTAQFLYVCQPYVSAQILNSVRKVSNAKTIISAVIA